MRQGNQIPRRIFRAIFLAGLAVLLAACAGRPKPLDPTTPFNVTEVRVVADSVEDVEFASRLQRRLEASVGRATADIGQTSLLRIVIQDRRQEPSPVNWFGGESQSASLDLSLIDVDTDRLLRSQALRATSSDFHGHAVETLLIARLTDEIRGLLGLSGYTPYPVRGPKRDVVRPSSKPEFDASDEALRSVDPLLNGTVTPTTIVLDVEPDTAPVMDYSKPLLDSQSSTPTVVIPSAAPGTEPEAQELRSVSTPADAEALDEPCIITLDNDCSDPDSR